MPDMLSHSTDSLVTVSERSPAERLKRAALIAFSVVTLSVVGYLKITDNGSEGVSTGAVIGFVALVAASAAGVFSQLPRRRGRPDASED